MLKMSEHFGYICVQDANTSFSNPLSLSEIPKIGIPVERSSKRSVSKLITNCRQFTIE